jgi:hypothetical protein
MQLVSPNLGLNWEWGCHVAGAMTLVRLRFQQQLQQDAISQVLSVATMNQHVCSSFRQAYAFANANSRSGASGFPAVPVP